MSDGPLGGDGARSIGRLSCIENGSKLVFSVAISIKSGIFSLVGVVSVNAMLSSWPSEVVSGDVSEDKGLLGSENSSCSICKP